MGHMVIPFAILGIFGLASAPALQEPPTQPESAPPAPFQKDLAWKHLVKQCEFGPRVPGTKAHTDCQAYLLAETKKNCDNVRLQTFNHTWSIEGKTYEMASKR